MSGPGLFYWNNKLQRSVPQILRLEWEITAAVTVAPLFPGLPALTTFSAIAAQSTIDNFLGTTNEFLIAAFDATAMGADTMGVIVNMGGQATAIGLLDVICFSGTGGGTQVRKAVKYSTALTASTLTTEIALGANGNVAFKVDFGNTPDFDGLTSGLIVAEFSWIAK